MAPGRKSKSKADELDANEARQGLQLLDRNQQLPRETLERIFKLGQAACPPTCGTKGSKGNKDNPECFHGLLPPEGSHRKKGLWQKEPAIGQLGHDPADDKRMGPDVPAGLRNLGSTCYVNAAMQFLHAIPEFRRALYVLEPEIAEQEVVRQLRDLFIEMHFGPRRYVDPEPFANSLQLNHAIQQDGQEFLKLLLTKLEHVFAASGQQEVAGVVQRLFRGHFSYVTTCRCCQQQSAGSQRQVEYYELPLQVQHMPSLQQSMVSALASEELVGDNQYYCDSCGRKCNADRQMRLRSLPPYLCLSLQRFVFDMQTFEKKKAMTKLSIPLLLDLGTVLAASGLDQPDTAPVGPDGTTLLLPGDPGAVYELAAVLIHKGTSASHGHYVAHIKVPDTGSWWRFDDEAAEEMGATPINFPADHGTTAQAQAAATAAAAAADRDEATEGSDAVTAAVGTGKKRGRGGSTGGSSKHSRGAAGTKRGGRQTRDEEDSDYEEVEDKKAKNRGRGRGTGKPRGRGGSRRGRKSDAAAAAADYDEEAATEAAIQKSWQDQVAQQAAALASFGGVGAGDFVGQAGQQQQPHVVAMDCDARPDAAAATAAEQSEPASKRRKRGATVAAADADAAVAAAEAPQQLPEEQIDIVSGNAYFVVYRQRISPIGKCRAAAPEATADAGAAAPAGAGDSSAAAQDAAAAGDAAAGPGAAANGPEQVQLNPQLLRQLASLPEAVHQRVLQLRQDFLQACANHQQMKADAVERVVQRQQEVAGISQLLSIPEGSEDGGCFIPAPWLESWANSEDGPGPVDNGQLLCSHQRLNPGKSANSFKRVSTTAWEALVGNHQGGPQLTLADACPTCLRALLQGLVGSDMLAQLREELLDSLAADEVANAGAPELAVGFLVSKTWLTGFRTRQRLTGGSLQPPTAGITCCHGGLAPEALSGAAKRLVVSDTSWNLLKQVWAMQVVQEVGLKRAKAAKAAAQRAAAGEEDDGDVKIVAEQDADGDVKIVDAPETKQDEAGAAAEATNGHQQQDEAPEEVEVQDSDTEQHQEQQQEQHEQQQGAERAGSPGAAAGAIAALASWQFPVSLDGSVEVTEEQLLQALPSFHSVHAMECEQCRASLQEAAAGHQEVKQLMEAQKQALSKLLVGSVTENLEQGVAYYLVPNDWIAAWRAHVMAASSKKLVSTGLPPPPPPLPDAIRPLLCSCHPEAPGLAVQLPVIVNKRGRFAQADAQKEPLRIVTEQDWQQLLLHHSGLTLEEPEQQEQHQQQQQQQLASSSLARKAVGRPRHNAAAAAAAAPGSRQAQQQQQAQRQEQLDVMLQRIASLADQDPGFRGIQAFLHVEAQPEGAAGDEQQQQQQQPTVQEQQPPMVQEQHQQQQQPQPCMNGLHEQQPAQQRQAEPMDADVVVCVSPVKDVASVDLTSASPVKQLAAAAAAAAVKAEADQSAGEGGVEVMAEVATPRQANTAGEVQGLTARAAARLARQRPPAAHEAAAAGKAAPLSLGGEFQGAEFSSESDPVGLESAAAKPGDDDWQPDADDEDSQQQQQRHCSRHERSSRPRRRGAAAAADAGDTAGDAQGAAAASLRGWLTTKPAPCQQHLAAVSEAQRAALLVYDAAEVMVELIGQDELPTAFAAAGAERKSRRARKNRQPLKVSSTDTLAQLRLKVFEALSLHPKNQHLYARSRLLEGEQNTLAQLEIFPDEELRVVNTNEVPNDDYASVFDGVSSGKRRREVETGFKDTALLGPSIAPAAAAARDEPKQEPEAQAASSEQPPSATAAAADDGATATRMHPSEAAS